MATAILLSAADNNDEKQGRVLAWIVTSLFFLVLMIVLVLVKIVTPIPAIPPPPDEITLEVGIVPGSGGDVEFRGGGSQGNTRNPGMQQPAEAASNPHPNPPQSGSVTDANSSNPSAPAGNHPSQTNQTSVNPELEAALNSWNKNKGKATIQVGGQGNGSPYTGGIGDGSGDGPGPGNGGDPGNGGNGGSEGNDPSGKNYRRITYKPAIVNPTQEEGKVVVIVHVNREGNVTRTEIGTATTTVNSVLRSTASQSAYQIKFNPDPNAPLDQAISIDINFTLK
jgi:outer membrane biosynthesis protein TonB